MHSALAVVLEQPERLSLTRLALDAPAAGDVVVETAWSGISTGTERLLFTGRMPQFPGMGYPLVPGYESVGRIVEAGPEAKLKVGTEVFVPGARCFGPVRGLFGGAASHLVAPAARLVPLPASLGDKGVLFALAATALHARAGARAGRGRTDRRPWRARAVARAARRRGGRQAAGRVGKESRPRRRRRRL